METEVTRILSQLEATGNEADPAKAESVLWLEDERFTEIEDFIPKPIGAEGVRSIHDWLKQNGTPGDHVHFQEIKTYPLAPTVAYVTAIQHIVFDEPSTSRVTFVLLCKDGRWGVIHAHYSTMPAKDV